MKDTEFEIYHGDTLANDEALREGKIDMAGDVSDDKLRSVLQRWVEAYQRFVESHAARRG